MRKLLLLSIAIVEAINIVACNNQNKADNSNTSESIELTEVSSETNEQETQVVDKSSKEYYLSLAETSVDNFEYKENGEEITITKCLVKDSASTVVVIPNKINNKNVVALDTEVFANKEYEAVILNKELKIIGNSCFMSSNIPNIIIQEGVEEIYDKAFYLSGITKIELPNTIKNIYRSSFALCEIKELNIPASVELLESTSFSLCSSLEIITFEGKPIVEKGAFSMCDKINKIICKNGDLEFEDKEFNSMSVDAEDILFVVPDNSKIKEYIEKQEFTYEIIK